MMKRDGGLWWTIMAVGMLSFAVCREPKRYTVGGASGWTQGVNYTEWAIHQKLYVGDWLYFVFDKHAYTVLEVNKTNYENCIAENFITNITRGGRDVFNLKQARPYYFLSSGGYCFGGMKLAINVLDYVPPAPAPATNYGHINAHSPPAFLIVALGISLGCAFPFLKVWW